jgi:hypothetical protein
MVWTYETYTAHASHLLRACAYGPDSGKGELVLTGDRWDHERKKNSKRFRVSKSKKSSAPNAPLHEEDNFTHVRFALQLKGTNPNVGRLFVGHRQYNYRDGSFSAAGPFKNARIWNRRADAVRYAGKNEEVVEVTCAYGAPFAVFTQ